jgi:hypothetical protein
VRTCDGRELSHCLKVLCCSVSNGSEVSRKAGRHTKLVAGLYAWGYHLLPQLNLYCYRNMTIMCYQDDLSYHVVWVREKTKLGQTCTVHYLSCPHPLSFESCMLMTPVHWQSAVTDAICSPCCTSVEFIFELAPEYESCHCIPHSSM